jgi:SAM-dependent methyltransferase
MNQDDVRARFAATAGKVAELEERRRAVLAEQVRAFVPTTGAERALDSAAGTGALAFALAPLVREVVAVDLVPELLAEGRARAAAFPNVTFVEGDATRLPVADASFDLAATIRSLHHIADPVAALAELVRATRPGGTVVVIDQIAPDDVQEAAAIDRFERARDASHTRLLTDAELRAVFAAHGLELVEAAYEDEQRDLDRYLDLADCVGEARERALALAPSRPAYTTRLAWYRLRRAG